MIDNSSRREFLKQAGTFSACICCMGALSFLESCGTSKKTVATAIPFTETVNSAVIPLPVFSDKNFVIIQTTKFHEPVYIAKQPDNSFIALRMYCTHKGCTIKDTADKFVCPCHGSEFAHDGSVLHGPAKEPLQSFPVTTDASNVTVHFA